LMRSIDFSSIFKLFSAYPLIIQAQEHINQSKVSFQTIHVTVSTCKLKNI
jgi:hypothetical protein